MWTTEKTRRATISPRPLRVAYIVPLKPEHVLLDVIFDEAMSRWGGRRTPVIMSNGSEISEADWAFLDLWDADIVYSYVLMSGNLHDRIAHCLAPSAIDIHAIIGEPRDKLAFLPETHALRRSLRSISILPQLARQQEIRRDSVLEVLDKEPGSEIARDLADSFGLSPYARRLSYREAAGERFAPRFRGDDVISYISDVRQVESRLSSDYRLLYPSQMSDMFCPFLNALGDHRVSWEDQLTIVIGDSIEDRLVYWNAIHRYKSLDSFRSNQILRFGLERFQEGIPEWIMNLCGGTRNSRRINGNGAPNVQIISSSVEAERLKEISNHVGGSRHIMSSSGIFSPSNIFEPLVGHDPRKGYEYSLILWPAWYWQDIKTTKSVRLENNEIDLPYVKPWHTNDFPLGPTTVGAWLGDLQIERIEDHSQYENVIHSWMFPRRLALHRALKIENYGDSRGTPTPSIRPTERGCLSLWDDPRWQRPTVRLPKDIDAFRNALFMHHPNTINELASHKGHALYARIETVKLSDKGRDLLGVLKFFGNLIEAVTFLTNPFILSIISKLSPTDTAESPDRILSLKVELSKRLKDKEVSDDDLDRTAKRVLELAARWLQKDFKDNKYFSYAELRQRLKERTKDGESVDQNSLDECVMFLRNQNFLIQGFGWKCERCQHPNWVGLTDISNVLECVICNSSKNAPVGGDSNSHFRLNPFVSAAFAPTSAQGSVIWCLSLLLGQARHSFMLTPTLDIMDKFTLPGGTDLDVLACVDGKVHFYEVKKSSAGINKKQIADLVRVANILRPDYAGFAIQDSTDKTILSDDEIHSVKAELRKIDVNFVLMTGNQNQHLFGPREVPSNVGDTMQWHIW
jgi:hypothetical protein